MTKLQRLQREAREAAKWRGHLLGRWTRTTHGALAECTVPACSADGEPSWVQIDTRPAPNGIDIAGPAVAVHCVGRRGLDMRPVRIDWRTGLQTGRRVGPLRRVYYVGPLRPTPDSSWSWGLLAWPVSEEPPTAEDAPAFYYLAGPFVERWRADCARLHPELWSTVADTRKWARDPDGCIRVDGGAR